MNDIDLIVCFDLKSELTIIQSMESPGKVESPHPSQIQQLRAELEKLKLEDHLITSISVLLTGILRNRREVTRSATMNDDAIQNIAAFVFKAAAFNKVPARLGDSVPRVDISIDDFDQLKLALTIGINAQVSTRTVKQGSSSMEKNLYDQLQRMIDNISDDALKMRVSYLVKMVLEDSPASLEL